MKKMILAIVCLVVFMSCDTGMTYTSDFVAPSDREIPVRYEISGTAPEASLTYSNAYGGTEQMTVNLPYTIEYADFHDLFKYISAQNQTSSGSVTVKLYISSSLAKSSTSSGAYVIATASYYGEY